MPYNEAIEARIKNMVSSWANTDSKKMFGGICHLLKGNMFCGVYKDFLILRLGEENADKALTFPFVKPFDITGRPMKGWIMVEQDGFKNDEEDFSTYEIMLKVHNLALIKLCHVVLPYMVSKGKGIIINVSSLSAFTPFPANAVYSASKAFVKLFTESIHLELQGTGVRVQALCPGMTRTDFHEKMGFDKNTVYKDRGMMKAMTPEEVVDLSLQYLEKDKVLCVPGGNNKVSRFLLKILPQAVIYKFASTMMRK